MTPVVQVVDRQCTAYTHGGYGERCKKLARVNGLCTAHSKHNDIYREPRDPGPWADSRFIYVLGGDALVIKVGASVDPSSRLAQIKSGDSRFHALEPDKSLRLLAARREFHPFFTEIRVHEFLGSQDRIFGEWWNLTERILIKLALMGLTWPNPVYKVDVEGEKEHGH